MRRRCRGNEKHDCGRFKSGHPRCCAQLISNVRQCDNSTLQSRRSPCGRTAAHRPTHFCKDAAPAILPEANLVLPPTKGVASCPDPRSVVCVRRDARKNFFFSTPASSPNPPVTCRVCQLARQHIAPYREDHTRPRRQQGRDEGAEHPRQDETTHTPSSSWRRLMGERVILNRWTSVTLWEARCFHQYAHVHLTSI